MLKSGAIRTAALDVWENEPDIDPELIGMLFSGTPHIAGYSADGKAAGTAACVQAFGEYFDLPCREWSVQDIPQPLQSADIVLDAAGKKPQEILGRAILHTYDITDDDTRLRANPGLFEELRSDYPVRREFKAFSVKLSNDTSGRATVFLREAGFNISE